MILRLAILRCPEAVAPETRSIAGGEMSIGRGSENDWVLADPDRHVSKRHCVISFRGGQWQLVDASSNGTFLNHEAAPVGAKPRTLRQGDRISFGAYEIEVALEEERTGQPPTRFDPFPEHGGWDAPGTAEPPIGRARSIDLSPSSALLPDDFDPLADDADGSVFKGPVRSDHAPAVESAFPPPRVQHTLPDDWNIEPPATPAAPPPAPPPPIPPSPPPRAAEPAPQPGPGPNHGHRAGHDHASDHGLMAAFLRGAGLPETPPDDPERTMERAGAVLRAAVAGLRQVLIARLSVKSEFRIEQTMVRARGNNPLKFSADDDDALTAIVGQSRPGLMRPEAAVTEALRDIRLHELATMAALQSAAVALLAQLDPAKFGVVGQAGGLGKLMSHGKARAWDNFVERHHQVTRAMSDDFDSVFGKAFARAYEQAMRDLADEKDPP